MTGSYAIAILAAVGAYVGTLYASTHVRPRATDATAQAYRDMIAALNDMHRACLDIRLARDMGEKPSEELFAARNRASVAVSRTARSASFLFEPSDLDLLDEVIGRYGGLGLEAERELIEQIDKASSRLGQSAHRIFRRGR